MYHTFHARINFYNNFSVCVIFKSVYNNEYFNLFNIGVSNSRCLITMVPKSYVDLKRYLVDDTNLAGGDMETVKIVQKPILPSPKPKEMVPLNTPDDSLTSSDVISSSVNSSLTNLENPIQDIDCSALASMKQRKRSFITASKDLPASGDQFRKRVMSSDR